MESYRTIIMVAVVGKFLGSALATKFVGAKLEDSLTIGALMNTRGLMELIVLNRVKVLS
jgi:Kef-type K+ transport system membrane component KefB